MATKRDRRSSSNDDQKTTWRPPRGIRYLPERKGRPRPWLLEWRVNGERQTQAYASEADRELAARELVEKKGEFGTEVLTFDPAEWRRWLAFKAEAPAGIDPMVILHEWQHFRQGTDAAGSDMTVADAITRYKELRWHVDDAKISDDTKRHIKKHVEERFGSRFGRLRLREITPEHIRGWLKDLRNGRTGEPVDALTKRHHRKDLNTFLKRAVAEGWIVRNPCDSVAVPTKVQEDVTVLSVEDAVKLFTANRDQPCIGRLALEAFGGLRYSSAARIQKEHLDFDSKGVAMPGKAHKSGKRKYRQGHAANLWAWLAHAPEMCWTMTVRQYLKAKGEAFVRAGVANPGNVLRHSFASYDLALRKDPPKTAYIMQHTSLKMLEIYEGIAKEADAAAYFALTPATCAPRP